ncbi:MAG: hypothetical protein KDB27_17125 [Planctomycetales bacterium]|nr:hypothetical protein [Planctomycetales bacterium]
MGLLRFLIGMSAVFVALSPVSVNAVVVSTTTENTTAPEDDPGWNNVAVVSDSTGIYLGNRWMLTARHIGAHDANFPGIGNYAANPATQVPVPNPSGGLTEFTDLLLYQLFEDPGLPPIELATATPKPGTEIIAIGNGRERAQLPTFWAVAGEGEDAVWTESDEADSTHSGYKTLNSNTIRWGTNLVEGDSLLEGSADRDNTIVVRVDHPVFGGADVIATITEFDLKGSAANERIKGPNRQPDTEFEMQAALNDSGGGMFVKEDGNWVLAGIMLAVHGFQNQPDVAVTPIYGNSTLYADIATYREQIVGSLVVKGDFDGDGLLTANDIDLLSAALDSDDLSFDLNGDELLDAEDHRFWVENLRYTYFGDANLDGEFNTTDFVNAFSEALYETDEPATWESGDWNGDGVFNSRDFIIALQAASFEQGPRSRVRVGRLVPEPGCRAMFLFLVAGLAFRRQWCVQ